MTASKRPSIPADLRRALALGYSIVPLYEARLGARQPYVQWKPYVETPPTKAVVAKWHSDFPTAMWAVVVGEQRDLAILDFDREEGCATFDRLGLRPNVLTPNDGVHVYVSGIHFPISSGSKVDPEGFPGLDIKGEVSLATFYGDRPSAGAYRVVSLEPTPIEDLPEELRRLLHSRRRAPARPVDPRLLQSFDAFVPGADLLAEALQAVSSGGGRHDANLWLACQLRDERVSFEAAEKLVNEFAAAVRTHGQHEYTAQEAYACLVDAFAAPARAPRRLMQWLPHTDLGNAQRMVLQHGHCLLYCHELGTWLVWDGRRWAPDVNGAVERLAKQTVRSMLADAATISDDLARDKLIAHARRSENVGRIEGMIRLAKSEERVLVRTGELDADPMVLNVRNCVIDLNTGERRDHHPSLLCSKVAAVDFDPGADAPVWMRYLSEVLPDPATRAYVQEVAGYCLTGLTREHVLFLLHGPGGNGKSKFAEALLNVMGDYGQAAPEDLLLAQKGSGPTNDLARLVGARLVVASETDHGRSLNEARVKALTGGDRMSARKLYQDFFDFVPIAKYLIYTNHLPRVRGGDVAMRRRLRKIPFNVFIQEERADKNLSGKLSRERAGILNWALEGLRRYLERGGFAPSEEVLGATTDYLDQEDLIGQFLADATVPDPESMVSIDDLHDALVEWAPGQGYPRAWSRQQLGREMSDRGFLKQTPGKRKVTHYVGLRLRVGPTVREARAHVR